MIPILYHLFQKIETKKTLQNSSCETSITLIPKPGKDIIRKENNRSMCLTNIDENSQQNISKLNPTMYKKYCTT